MRLTLLGETHEVEIVRRRPTLLLRIDGRLREVSAAPPTGDGPLTLTFEGRDEELVRAGDDERSFVRFGGRTYDIALIDPRAEAAEGAGGHDEIRAPMPGIVVSVAKAAGDAVARGDLVLTIESMKLQTAVVAPRDGVLAAIGAGPGVAFARDAVLARLEPEE